MIPIVDRAGFNSLTCNRCGECCEMLKMDEAPTARLAKFRADKRWHFDGCDRKESMRQVNMIARMLIPTRMVTHADGTTDQYYRCKYFKRDRQGLGVCGAYARRPHMCSAFPYAKPAGWPRCSWYVRLVPKLLPMARTA